MSSKNDGVRDYFNRISDDWDAFYSDGNSFQDRLNRVFRHALYERLRLTLDHCGEIAGARVLDLGSGTGQYSVEFARRGASRVLGIDFAPSMVASSERLAQEQGVAGPCEFICADFANHTLHESFDIVLALGFFDYIEHPELLLKKIKELTESTFVASFPSNNLLWRIQRRIRYNWIKGCPVFDYTPDLVRDLYATAGFTTLKIIPMKRGLFVVARP
jgi:2-polyprenyl-3-methyl-5-hydroxy-6-metoxy-1,4-benzoquinol methylase